MAEDIRPGDCLHTADGKRTIRKVNQVAIENGDVNELAGDIDAVAVGGGVFTHAIGRHGHQSYNGGIHS